MPTKPTNAQTPPVATLQRRATALPAPFTTGQQAILQLLNRPLTEGQLKDIWHLIGEYLAHQTDALAQQVWRDKGYTQADMDALLNTHIRTPYKKR